jgi:hypothetical protein
MIHGFYGNIKLIDRAGEVVAESCAWLRQIFAA